MSMSDAEIREALARAERARRHVNGLCIGTMKWRMRVPPQADDSDLVICNALDDSKRLAADLLAARAERDLALSLRNTATNVLADVVAHRDSLAARCRELEGFLRGLLHASSGTRDENAAALLSRLETRAQVLLSPPTPHTCQIHRATSGASDCGLSPCEEATVHTDRGAARPATVRRVQPTPSQEARCGSRTKLRGSDGRPLCERHGGVRADFQQNDEPCMRVQATPVEDMPRAQVQAELAARWIDVAPAVATVMDALGMASECACPDPRCAQHGSAPAPCSSCVGDAPAKTATHEAAKCATCDGQVLGSPDEQGEPFVPTDRPCPDCGGGA